jgi:hypothetical protein
VDLSSDPGHCGSCPHACAFADATPACRAGSCGIASCTSGYADCDGLVANGCESYGDRDAAHCGGCDVSCQGATPFCRSGSCAATAPLGISQNASASALAAAGLSQCHSELYSGAGASLEAIASACSYGTVVIACRAVGSDTLIAFAMGSGGDVFFDTGPGNAAHEAGGVAWYHGSDSSWGFAPAGSSIDRRPCDLAGTADDGYAGGASGERLCWPTAAGVLSAGGRCGEHVLQAAELDSYERLVFTKP